jgi:hypothetical protein
MAAAGEGGGVPYRTLCSLKYMACKAGCSCMNGGTKHDPRPTQLVSAVKARLGIVCLGQQRRPAGLAYTYTFVIDCFVCLALVGGFAFPQLVRPWVRNQLDTPALDYLALDWQPLQREESL